MDWQTWADLVRWEGVVPHLYRDTRGYVTIGVGFLVEDRNACVKLPLLDGDQPATTEQKDHDWQNVLMCPLGLAARQYAGACKLRLSEQAIRALADSKLAHFEKRLVWLCPGYRDFPEPARRALVDMAWNLGIGGLSRYRKMLAAIDRRDWAGAALECDRSTSRDERNEWTRRLFQEASNGNSESR